MRPSTKEEALLAARLMRQLIEMVLSFQTTDPKP
jgi:hypothetical protein